MWRFICVLFFEQAGIKAQMQTDLKIFPKVFFRVTLMFSLCTFQVPHGWIAVHRVLYIISQCGLAKQNDWGTFCFRMPVLRRVVFSLLPGAKQFPLQAVNTPLCALLQLQDAVYYWMIDALHDAFVLTPTHQHPTEAMHMHGSSYNFILDPDLSSTHNERNIQLNMTMHGSTNLFTHLLSNTQEKEERK